MAFKTLRDFLTLLSQQDELKKIDGAHWDLEMGAITELMWEAGGPALLFDHIRDYPQGYRVVANVYGTKRRCLLALSMPLDLAEEEAKALFEKRLANYKPIPPRRVDSGLVTENILEGDAVDLLKLPAPRWHELDGGRYIGTGCCVTQRDPDSEWINVGTYRVMVHDRKTAGVYVSVNHHGELIQKKYWERGQSSPVAVCLGPDPMLFFASGFPTGEIGVRSGLSEYDLAGYLNNEPVDVVVEEYTQLPIPANSEAVLVGEIPPPQVETRPEGPFGEFTGYYAHGSMPEPVIRVKAIYYRNDPIILGSPPMKHKGPSSSNFALDMGVRDVKGRVLSAGIHVLDDHKLATGVEVIKIKQRYPGHAVAAGLAAVGIGPKIIIVVDEDVNIHDPEDVLWAVGTRLDPEVGIEIVKNCQSHALEPSIPMDKKLKGDFTTSKIVINACKPYHRTTDFPPVNKFSEKFRREVLQKWSALFQGLEVKA
jgi:4-hydroxy-3-polyprenylbenzoate decarboxylase